MDWRVESFLKCARAEESFPVKSFDPLHQPQEIEVALDSPNDSDHPMTSMRKRNRKIQQNK
jgi:hypothetical protein